jgi:uncharacterized protein
MFRIRLSFWPLMVLLPFVAIASAQDQARSAMTQGLLFQGRPAQTEVSPPESFAERQTTFTREGAPPVSATLCLPLQVSGKIPLVLLLPDPGPADLVSGDAFPFASLAHSLAQAGIATLRYDKRELSPSVSGHAFTLQDEILDDADAALLFASKVPEATPTGIFLLAHGLGGSLATYIAQDSKQLRGLILLAPAVMPIEYTLARYKREQLSREGKTEAQIAENLDAQNRMLADIRSGKLANERMILGAPASYWRDWMNRDIAGELNKLSLPMLVLQAGRDARSNQAEFDKLETAIGDKPRQLAEIHWFLNLDMHFMPTTPGAQEDYQVDHQVIESISSWVQEHTDSSTQNRK